MAKQSHTVETLAPGRPPDTLVAVDRAVAELRRGGFAVIRTEGAALLVQAAEAVTPQSLDRLASLTGAEPRLALTPRRGAALGIETEPGADEPVLLAVKEGSTAQEVRDIADPGAAVIFRPPPPVTGLGGPERACYAAAVEITKLSRLLPAALAAPVTPPEAAAGLIRDHDLLSVTAEEVASYQLRAARSLKAASQARVPLAGADNARIVAYRPSDGGIEHLAIVIGDPGPEAPVLTRLHSECFTGDLLGSLRCDCGDQLRGAIEEISGAGAGILIYLAQEGRGIGLVNKLRAYNLQDEGLDTLEANEQLGFDADERIYLPAAEILRDLGFARVRLMTNNPDKVTALERCGIEVTERVPHVFPSNLHNEIYLRTKRSRSGHMY